MNVDTGTWDVKCPGALGRLFPRRSGYYFRVDARTAKKVLRILSKAYGVPEPDLGSLAPGNKDHAQYEYDTKRILLYQRNHLKTIFHEFYHHLDNMTDGLYNSDDHEGGPTSLAWIFADMLWEQFTSQNKTHNRKRRTMKKPAQPDSPVEGIEPRELLLASPIVVRGKRRRPKRDGCNGGGGPTVSGGGGGSDESSGSNIVEKIVEAVAGGAAGGAAAGNRRLAGQSRTRLHSGGGLGLGGGGKKKKKETEKKGKRKDDKDQKKEEETKRARR